MIKEFAAFVLIGVGSAACAEPVKKSANLRLTVISNDLGGSNCSLFLDQKLRQFVGGAEYDVPMVWNLGVNGKNYELKSTHSAAKKEVLISKDKSLGLEITILNLMKQNHSTDMPSNVSRVSVSLNLKGKSQSQIAYQFCGEG